MQGVIQVHLDRARSLYHQQPATGRSQQLLRTTSELNITPSPSILVQRLPHCIPLHRGRTSYNDCITGHGLFAGLQGSGGSSAQVSS